MSKAEKFIQDNIKSCSNVVAYSGMIEGSELRYHERLTPDQALRAVEIARGEMIEKLRKWVASKNERDSFTIGYIDRHFDELLKQAMKDG